MTLTIGERNKVEARRKQHTLLLEELRTINPELAPERLVLAFSNQHGCSPRYVRALLAQLLGFSSVAEYRASLKQTPAA